MATEKIFQLLNLSPEALLSLAQSLPVEQQKRLLQVAMEIRADLNVWKPNPGPQTMAFFSEAAELLYGGAAGGGKGISQNIQIPCINGYIRMGDIQIGDKIFDENGEICNVIAVSGINHRRCFKFTFDDGSELIADDVHKWRTFNEKERQALLRCTDEFREKRRKNRASRALSDPLKPSSQKNITISNKNRAYEYKDIPTGEVRDTLELVGTIHANAKGRLNHSIRNCLPLNPPPATLPIDPYTLGLYLGDGISCNGDLGMLQEDIKIIYNFVPYPVIKQKIYSLPKYKRPFAVARFEGLKQLLKDNNLINNKHIPKTYLRASVEQRLELLRGILDTDGHVTVNGQIELGLSEPRLLRSVAELVRTLGIKCRICIKKCKPPARDSHKIKFVTNLSCFKLPRKLQRQKLTALRPTSQQRYIVSIEEICSVPTKCIAVDSPSNMYLAGESFIPTHNSDLLLGLAFHNHQKSIIFRREYPQLKEIIDRIGVLFGQFGRYNSSYKILKLYSKHKQIELGSMQRERDKEGFKGRPHDLKGYDEITDFSKTQYEFTKIWNRTSIEGQRTRVVCTTNPPVGAAHPGRWIIERWAPWIKKDYTGKRAESGELRYFIKDPEDNDVEVDTPEKTTYKGEIYFPKSRSFIQAKVTDNKYYMNTGYHTDLMSLDRNVREAYLDGNFNTEYEDSPDQLIPTSWIRLAQQRWRERSKPDLPMQQMGIDVARGGADQTVLAPRYGNWIDKLIKYPGTTTPDGQRIRDLVMRHIHHDAKAAIDVIGIGSSPYDLLREVHPTVLAVHGGMATKKTSRSKQLTFNNVRTYIYWHLSELLDPQFNEDVCLPDDEQLVVELCAIKFWLQGRCIHITQKEDIMAIIGRSPDTGDAVAYAFADIEDPFPRLRMMI